MSVCGYVGMCVYVDVYMCICVSVSEGLQNVIDKTDEERMQAFDLIYGLKDSKWMVKQEYWECFHLCDEDLGDVGAQSAEE